MNTVLTLYDQADEWYQGTYICVECQNEFMTYREKVPKFCPYCGVKFEALKIRRHTEQGISIETRFIDDEECEV